ncbi:N-ethylmaleimide reductase, FMN-linked [Legionella beliardensis]|uniref:N-ethylmaleimide reductase, FMN-linked n=2 Tax=Legionella beliardensis TaxID=91822 RepID=A0A378I3L5_9GAMM|nr:alkene reductase [Legionella beliardensis]STX29769.1 N-ethylmaleimide reductase, FMN-linked [Legionella beliardensis]
MNLDLLLSPFQLNKQIRLKNRIVMAPMTRNMANDDLSPTALMKDYYTRRADAGLIITEGTIIRADAKGYSNVPGIFTRKQIESWRQITDAVHANSGHIFSQIWHLGRVSHPHFLGGQLPISASETKMTGKVTRAEGLYYGTSRAATLDEIKDIINSYAIAAKNAIDAGFDGIELHGANGYLIDQFLHYHTNHRTDAYGGNPENMARFALDVVKACGEAIGYERVGLRLSPGAYLNEIIGDSRDALVFKYLLEQLNHLPIAYVHTGNFNDKITFEELNSQTMTRFIRTHYKGTLIACGSYDFEEGQEKIKNNDFDLLGIGRPFIANPNLIHQLHNNEIIRPYEATMLQTLY